MRAPSCAGRARGGTPEAATLTELLGMHVAGEGSDRARFEMADGRSGALVDVTGGVQDRGLQAGGTVHHVAFRAPDLETMTAWQQELLGRGVGVTQILDRQYFTSIYFREPGGVMFEIAVRPRDRARERHARFFRRLREGVFDEDDLGRQADDLAGFVETASAAYGIDLGALVAVGFSNGANIASALLLRRPGLLRGAVLLSAMVPFADPPAADLDGTLVVVSNGRRDPMIPASLTARPVGQLSARGAEVVELPHAGGHQIHPGVLPQVQALLGA